jgi:hypothetical protein
MIGQASATDYSLPRLLASPHITKQARNFPKAARSGNARRGLTGERSVVYCQSI